MKIAIENLNRVKTIKQFTHKKLAEKTGYSRHSIQKLFSYHKNSKTRLDLVVTVCKALDIDFPSIFDRKTEMDILCLVMTQLMLWEQSII